MGNQLNNCQANWYQNEEICEINDGNQEGKWGFNQSILISKARKYKFDQRLHGFFKDQPGMPTLRNFNSHVAGTTFKKDCHAHVMLEPAPQNKPSLGKRPLGESSALILVIFHQSSWNFPSEALIPSPFLLPQVACYFLGWSPRIFGVRWVFVP